MSEHTPGPWIQRAGHPHDVEAPESGHVCTCELEADAHLIAAAPTMFDFIKKRAAAGDTEAAVILGQINADS